MIYKGKHVWFTGRLAPKAWREPLARYAPNNMSAFKTAKEGFFAMVVLTFVLMRLFAVLAKYM